MNNPLISIIVPIYNAESYLNRCLDSILAQTYKNWEAILVDDGSKDNSGKICDEYAKNDNRFKVIHKANGGVSSARQTGLEAAIGDFVIHADSDDWLENNMLEELIDHQRKISSEFIVFDFYRANRKGGRKVSKQSINLDHRQLLKDIVSGHINNSCWNKLIKKSIIDNYNACFPKGINLGEDKCFLAILLKNPVKVTYLSKPLYNHDETVNPTSLVRKISMDSMESGFAMVNYLDRLLGKEYNNSIFHIKRKLKIRAIRSGFYSDRAVRNMYKEINKKIIFNTIMFRIRSKSDIMLFLHTIGLYGLARWLR